VTPLRISIAVVVTFALLFGFDSRSFAAPTVPSEPLVHYVVSDGGIAQSLTGVAGDPSKGKAIVLDRRLGNCLACHHMPVDAPFQGDLGPDLAGVGKRLTIAQLRLRIVNPKLINPETIMPAYYAIAGFHDIGPQFRGKPILAAQQVEDVVAFLATLK